MSEFVFPTRLQEWNSGTVTAWLKECCGCPRKTTDAFAQLGIVNAEQIVSIEREEYKLLKIEPLWLELQFIYHQQELINFYSGNFNNVSLYQSSTTDSRSSVSSRDGHDDALMSMSRSNATQSTTRVIEGVLKGTREEVEDDNSVVVGPGNPLHSQQTAINLNNIRDGGNRAVGREMLVEFVGKTGTVDIPKDLPMNTEVTDMLSGGGGDVACLVEAMVANMRYPRNTYENADEYSLSEEQEWMEHLSVDLDFDDLAYRVDSCSNIHIRKRAVDGVPVYKLKRPMSVNKGVYEIYFFQDVRLTWPTDAGDLTVPSRVYICPEFPVQTLSTHPLVPAGFRFEQGWDAFLVHSELAVTVPLDVVNGYPILHAVAFELQREDILARTLLERPGGQDTDVECLNVTVSAGSEPSYEDAGVVTADDGGGRSPTVEYSVVDRGHQDDPRSGGGHHSATTPTGGQSGMDAGHDENIATGHGNYMNDLNGMTGDQCGLAGGHGDDAATDHADSLNQLPFDPGGVDTYANFSDLMTKILDATKTMNLRSQLCVRVERVRIDGDDV